MTLRIKRQIANTVSYVLLAILSIYCAFPFVWMVISSLKPRNEIRVRTPSFMIENPTLDNFVRVLFGHNFTTYVRNSLIVSVSACALSLAISILAGYAFSRYYRKRAVKYSNLGMPVSYTHLTLPTIYSV